MTTSATKNVSSHSGQLGPKFRAVLPKAVREALKVEEGDTLIYLLEGENVRLTTRRQLAEELCGSLARDDGRDLTAEFLAERRAEAEAEKGPLGP